MGEVVYIARDPNYCCDWWEYMGHIHFRCVHLQIDGFNFKCAEGIPLDEEQWPPIVECSKYKESDAGCSIMSEVIIHFPERE